MFGGTTLRNMREFADKLPRQITGEGCKSAEFDCIPQPQLYYFYALCDAPVSDGMKFKRETMNKHILLFITFIGVGIKFVITCCLPAAENAWPSQISWFLKCGPIEFVIE